MKNLQCFSTAILRVPAPRRPKSVWSRDGKNRAKLTNSLAAAFLGGIVPHRFEQDIATCAGDLEAVRRCMTARACHEAPFIHCKLTFCRSRLASLQQVLLPAFPARRFILAIAAAIADHFDDEDRRRFAVAGCRGRIG